MGWATSSTSVALALLALQALSLLMFAPGSAASVDEFLAPLLSPILNETCKVAPCGKGTCKASVTHAFGFTCECDDGWSQLHVQDHLRFLPCVIPNCSLNYSCSNESLPPAQSPDAAPPSNPTFFDPCFWSFCGGGSCVKKSSFEHQCDCNDGYSNLLNVTTFPCYKDCSIGADCFKLGISLSNATATSPSTNAPADSSSASGGYSSSMKLLWLFFYMVSLAVVMAA